MTDNIVQTLQHLLQDVIAPDVRELKVRVGSLEKQMDVRFSALDQRLSDSEKRADTRFAAIDQRFVDAEKRTDARFTALDQKMDAQFKALLSAISESRAQADLTSTRLFTSLSERVAVLESRGH